MNISIFTQKGGVGKTTTALNLSAAFSERGISPLLIDLDPQCHLTSIRSQDMPPVDESFYAFLGQKSGLKELSREWGGVGRLIPAHDQMIKADSVFGKGLNSINKLRIGLETEGSSDEIVIMDCCPYIGVLSLNALFSTNLIIIPVSTDYLSLRAAEQITKSLDSLSPVMKRSIQRRYLLTRYNPALPMTQDVRDKLKNKYGDMVLETVIHESPAIAESPAYNQSVFGRAPKGQGACDHRQLLDELIRRGDVVVQPPAEATSPRFSMRSIFNSIRW